jgi:uncharacterized membrane protein YccC
MALGSKLFSLAFAGLLASPAGAELATWDQARVTELAGQLASACRAFDDVVQQEPGTARGAEDAGFGVQANARELRAQSEALAGHLREGKSHEQTRDLYRSLKEVVDDTEQNAQRTPLDEPVMDAWAKVADLMRQIAPYYDPKALDAAK